MRAPLSPAGVLALLVILSGCAAGGAGAGGSRSPDLITIEEIRGTSHATAHELIGALRPQWLRSRPPNSFSGARNASGGASNEVVVYVDNVRLGGAESLRGVRAEAVRSAAMVNAMNATQRWGTGHAAGAIVVITWPG